MYDGEEETMGLRVQDPHEVGRRQWRGACNEVGCAKTPSFLCVVTLREPQRGARGGEGEKFKEREGGLAQNPR